MLGGNSTKQGISANKIIPTLWAWGRNNYGQLGTRDTLNRSAPVRVDSDMQWIATSMSYSTAGIKNNGTLWMWGRNNAGQLGLGNTTNRSSPVQVGSGSTGPWVAVSTGGIYSDHSCTAALRNNGTLWMWGRNNFGQLGLGDTTDRSSPVQVGSGSTGPWASISCHGRGCAAITINGTLWTWGSNLNGHLGLGDTTNRSSPVQVGSGSTGPWALVSLNSLGAANAHTLAVQTNGTLWAWGSNGIGQIAQSGFGAGTRSSPVQIGSGSTGPWTIAVAGGSSSLAIRTDGTLWTWGGNNSGQLGLGNTVSPSSPSQVGTDTNWASATINALHLVAVKTNGTIWVSGSNSNMSLGIGNNSVFTENPVEIGSGVTAWIAPARVGGAGQFAIRGTLGATSGTLWAWGYGNGGALGLGDSNDRSVPTQVGTLSDWESVEGRLPFSFGTKHSCGKRTNGTIWTWGGNFSGQLGRGNTIDTTSPVQVGGLTGWARISAGRNFCSATRTDGTLWSWGANGNGQLGLSDTTNRSSPVQVGTDTNWSIVTGGGTNCFAIKTTGTLWAWGHNSTGSLGTNNTTDQSSPVQVGSGSTGSWVMVSAGGYFSNSWTVAIRGVAGATSGTLWAWGFNSFGQLGQGNVTSRSSPVQIGTDTNWALVSAGHTSVLALKTNGTLWAWGRNQRGQLGVGDLTDRSSPVQVGTAIDWISANSGLTVEGNCCAVKKDGTLWTWGNRSSGMGGFVPLIATISSPVQVGTATNWKWGATAANSNNAYGFVGVKILTTQNPDR